MAERCRRHCLATVLAATAAIAAACDPGSSPEIVAEAGPTPWLADLVADSGVEFVHRSGHADRYYIPEITVGGAAVFDADGDGLLDLYLVQSGSLLDPPTQRPPNRLYRNRGGFLFEDVTEAAGVGNRGYGCGVATGDYDNDGRVDLYVVNVGPNALLHNDGGRFTDVTASAGVGDDGFGSSAAFVDYDRDGDLDLFVLNYLVWSVETERDCLDDHSRPDYCAPAAYNAPAIDVLYRNNGDGTFSDVTREAGLGHTPGTGLGVVCGDFDGDGLTDLFVANDGMNDRLWVNLGDGRFEDRALLSGCAIDQEGRAKAGMGVTAGDIDDDGDLDLMVSNLVHESDSLFRNEGSFFADFTVASGLGAASRPFTRFGTAWADLDNDGWLDLYQANGRVARQGHTRLGDDPFAEPNLLFAGTGGGAFRAVSPSGGTAEPLIATSRAAAFGDLDNDGGIDIVVLNRDAPPHVLRNVVARRGHWITFRVLEEHGRDAIGATVRITLAGRTVSRDVRTAYSYCAANDPRVHFGLGEQDAVERVEVRWADGSRETFGPFAADRIVTLRRTTPHNERGPM